MTTIAVTGVRHPAAWSSGSYDHVIPPIAEILDDGTSAIVTP